GIGIKAVGPSVCGAEVVKLATKIGEIVVKGHVVLEAAHFRELHSLVEGDLSLRGLGLERRVPRTAIGTVEPAAERMRVSERRIDDAIVRNAEQQLAHADAGQQVVRSDETS